MPVGPYSQDALTRIYNVHWGLAAQQGLLAEYPPGPGAPDFESISEVLKGTPTAYALGSGQVFPGVNMGASGLGYTVLTRGLVCFGTPRGGDACFLACPGFYAGNYELKRGALDENGRLTWSGAGSGGRLVALSFAEDAFFAVYYNLEADITTIATSFDGLTWSSAPAFPSSGDLGAYGGAVAATSKIDDNDKKIITYVAAGDILQDNSGFRNSVSNLMWAISSDGAAWVSGSNMGMMAEPGTKYDLLFNYTCTIAAGAVIANNKVRKLFVVAAGTKTLIPDPHGLAPFAMLTSAPAVSETGSAWNVAAVGLPAGLDQISFGLAAAYCRETVDSGHFLMTDHEYITGEAGHAIPNSNLYKSSDGSTWSKIKTNTNWMATLSAIDKDLRTIVNI